MKKLLTVKQAIKLRCQDCHENKKIKECKNKRCQIFQMILPGAKGRSKAIKDYCRWCRNGLSLKVCTSKKCSIYLYLNKIPISDKIINPNKRKMTDEQRKAVSERFTKSRLSKTQKED